VEGSCEHGNKPSVPENVGKFLRSSETGVFSRMKELHGVN
jgi:hypothetical protein